jgi:PAS domain S-box-containing protein
MSNSDDVVLLLEQDDAAEAVIIAANDAFHRVSGFSDHHLVGRPVAELFPVGHEAESLLAAVRAGDSLRAELRCSRDGGDSFALGMHLMPAPTRMAGRACFVILGRDITTSVQARQVRDSVQLLLAKVFSAVDIAVAIVNATGRIMMTNRHLDRVLGYRPNGLVGRPSLDLVAPGSHAALQAAIALQAADGCDARFAVTAVRDDGSEVPAEVTSVVATTGEAKTFRILTLRPTVDESTAQRSESVGRIRLVGLEAARAALGDRWAAATERAMTAAEAVIRRGCGPEETCWRIGDSSFLIGFGALSEADASYRTAVMGREIRSRMIGQGDSPDHAAVRSVAAVVRFPDQNEAGLALQAVLLDGLDRQIGRVEWQARQTLRDAPARAACDVQRVFGRAPPQSVASQVLVPFRLEREIISALGALPHAEAKDFDLDGMLLGLAAQHAVSSMARGDTEPLLVTIGFDLFATKATAERFLTLCARIDGRLTTRLVLLLAGLSNGVPRSRVQECVNRLRPFCRGVGHHIEDLADLPSLDLANGYNPIVVLPAAVCAAVPPAELRDLFSSLQSRRAKVLVREIGSEKEALAFVALGADMVVMRRGEAA